jgi:hydroxymethylbilane synthase
VSAQKNNKLVVGTRGSKLARAQTQLVVNALQAAHPGLDVETAIIKTTGDMRQNQPLPEIGGKGLFTAELEKALLDGSIDIAVHSAKDLPTDLQEGLDLLAYPKREDPRDVWISSDGTPFENIPSSSLIGTDSLRRKAQLLRLRRDLQFTGLRGNVDTRIKKIHRGDCMGAVLAMAGLKRSGLAGEATHAFHVQAMIPAPAQGALGLEGRTDDRRVKNYLQAIHDDDTAVAVKCERAILHELEAGCRAPVAALAAVNGKQLYCRALVISPVGTEKVFADATGDRDEPESVVQPILKTLRAAGADRIIAACRQY